MTATRLAENADEAAQLLALLANGRRLAILEQLLEGEMSVGALAKKFSLSQSSLSQHLARLRSLDLVETRRERQTIFYSCKSEPARRLIETLAGIFAKTEIAERRRRA